MREIRLNGEKMINKATVHAYLKEKLSLPNYYGENLDALWDCLSEENSLKKITLYNSKAMIDNLGAYGEAIIRVLEEVAKENENIIVDIEEDKGI